MRFNVGIAMLTAFAFSITSAYPIDGVKSSIMERDIKEFNVLLRRLVLDRNDLNTRFGDELYGRARESQPITILGDSECKPAYRAAAVIAVTQYRKEVKGGEANQFITARITHCKPGQVIAKYEYRTGRREPIETSIIF